MHLTIEALARLVDEPPAPGEAAHLRDCLVCRRELAALEEQTRALAALAGAPPSGAWERLAARLEDEGLVRTAERRPTWIHRTQLRAAAAVVLFLLGGAAGAALWSGRAPAPLADAPEATAPPAYPALRGGFDEPPVVVYETEPAPSAAGARLASNPAPEPTAPAAEKAAPDPPAMRDRAREADLAARELLEAQASFVAALQRLAAVADPASGNDPATRLAALDRLVGLTAAALERAPGDPVINGYHLAAAAERDALRREIDRDAGITWF